jgi:outer membrane protein OmpA-like peptidoglycan-associated protein
MRLVLGFLFIFNIAAGQNLVVNSSFENRRVTPAQLGTDNLAFFGLLNWSQPTMGTADYFFRKDAISGMQIYPYAGNQLPSTGNAYVGIISWVPGREYREYLTGELNTAPEKGKTYSFKMKISTGKLCPYFVENLGVYFSKAKIVDKSTKFALKRIPHIMLNVSQVMENGEKWTLVESTFIATGEEKYFTLGNFENDSNITVKTKNIPKKECPYNYYYIDDVVIEPVSGSILIFKDIQFDFDKTTLKPESYISLYTVVAKLKQNPTLKVTVNGYTDSVGTESYNVKLSKDRAKVVADYLISSGISKDRVSYNGYGSSKPISSDPSINRRVEFVFE